MRYVEKAEAEVQPLPRENLKSLLSYCCSAPLHVRAHGIHAIRQNQQSFILSATGIRGPERDVITVVIALPSKTREPFFPINVGDERTGLGRGSSVVASHWGLTLRSSAML